ncbi:hypothetical protein GL263_06910 [Streptomyces durbertensis]|uniref:Uncharacterized protein n=1 Tax=Streptomyces durbertensis TaxID=2448886 RepID=A0ABR6ED81_9ACTN|nr:hypothetical protein [Streptomyces durbertensis]MBB1243295.1 hypothetical protein [Streptomyces durbertensis]
MSSHLPLQPEDTEGFERALDRAFADPEVRSSLADAEEGTELRVRGEAKRATGRIMATADDEYRRYRSGRESDVTPAEGAERERSRPLVSALMVGGLLVSVAGALLLLVLGYLFGLGDGESEFAASLLNAARTFGIVALALGALGAVSVVRTALRHRADGTRPVAEELSEETLRAREEWVDALFERGTLPFLRRRLTAAEGTSDVPSPRPRSTGRRFSTGGFSSGQVSSGSFKTGQVSSGGFQSGQVSSGGFKTGEVSSGSFETGQFETGQFETGQFESGEFRGGGYKSGGVASGGFRGGGFGSKPPGSGASPEGRATDEESERARGDADRPPRGEG